MAGRLRIPDAIVATLLLLVVAAAAGLEGSVVRVYGGSVLAVGAVISAIYVGSRGIAAPGRLVRIAVVLLAVVVAWQLAPIPPAVRALVAPGQAAWLARVDPGWKGGFSAWQQALVGYDVEAAIGTAGAWSTDLLAGAVASGAHIGAVAPAEWQWTFALAAGCALLFCAGRELGRNERVSVGIAIAFAILTVAEVIFGLANRNGPSTGIGTKAFYLGSATGTFVNRGHFAAFVCLGVGAAWGLAASLFPLMSEEVRRHAARRNRSSQPPAWWETGGDRIPRLVLLAFAGATLALGVVASQSRGPLVGLGVMALAVGIWTRRRRKEDFHLGIALTLPVAGGGLAIGAFGPGGAFGRFVGLLAGGDVSVTSRLSLWRESAAAFLDSPVFGAGLGAWRFVWAMHEAGPHVFSFTHAHSEPIEWIVETGAVGGVGMALLFVAWAGGCLRAMGTAPHDPRTSVGIGMLVGVGAVLLQSLGDFPLHTPGVAVPVALCAGLALGALRPAEDARSNRTTFAVVMLGLFAAVAGGRAAWADHGFPGTREERVGEIPRVWYEGDTLRTMDAVRPWRDEATAVASDTPFDAWAHLAVARAESLLAAEAARAGGATAPGEGPEDHAFAADLAVSRALALHRREPRLLVYAARVFLRLSRAGISPDAYRERAVRMLADAVADDSWRAEDAYDAAADVPITDLARIAEAARGDGTDLARVNYQYGRALERRRETDAALAAYRTAAAADPLYGPPAFNAGVILHVRHEDAEAEKLLRSFLGSRDRPGGMEGWAYLLLGELDVAESRLRQVVEQGPKNRWAWEGLAEVARQRGNTHDEREAWQRIAEIAPDDPAVRKRLEALGSGK